MASRPPPIQPLDQPRSNARRVAPPIAATIALILAGVYANEGGYVNNPHDRGGATNYGITEKVARANGYAGDMRAFPKHCAEVASARTCADKIYVQRYIADPGFMPMVEIEPAVAAELVDTAVNMGPARPSLWFQQAVGVSDAQGRVGPATISAYRARQAQLGAVRACVTVLDTLDAKQAAWYRAFAARDPSQRVFLKGWLKHRIGNVDRAKCGKGLS